MSSSPTSVRPSVDDVKRMALRKLAATTCPSSAAPSSRCSRSKASATPRSPASSTSPKATRSGSFSRPRNSSRSSGESREIMTINCEQTRRSPSRRRPLLAEAAARHAAQSCGVHAEAGPTGTRSRHRARPAHDVGQRHALAAHRTRHPQRAAQHAARVWQIAAAILLVAIASARPSGRARRVHAATTSISAILKLSAVDEVERAEKAHIDAIDHLENSPSAKLDEPSTPLMVSYKEKLMMLDDAIAECQTNIDQNRQNALPAHAAAAMYSRETADAAGRAARGKQPCFESISSFSSSRCFC